MQTNMCSLWGYTCMEPRFCVLHVMIKSHGSRTEWADEQQKNVIQSSDSKATAICEPFPGYINKYFWIKLRRNHAWYIWGLLQGNHMLFLKQFFLVSCSLIHLNVNQRNLKDNRREWDPSRVYANDLGFSFPAGAQPQQYMTTIYASPHFP